MLTGEEIERQVAAGRITINKFDRNRVNPNSYNVRLSPEIARYDIERNVPIDPQSMPDLIRTMIPDEGIVLQPGVLYLGCTHEHVGSSYFVPCLSGRSSTGRIGMTVHITAGFGDLGYIGRWTLEITVVHRLVVYPLDEIAQFAFTPPMGRIAKLYSGRYKNQSGPTGSRLYDDASKPKPAADDGPNIPSRRLF